MANQPKIVADDIHLLEIDIVKSKIDTAAFNVAKNPHLRMGHKVMHNLKEERIKIELAFTFTGPKDIALLEIQIDFYFHIEHLKNFYQIEEENTPVFYGRMIITLLSIAVSTARGILYEKLRSDGIQNVIIPVVSTQKLFAAKN